MSEKETKNQTNIYGFRLNLHQKSLDAPLSNKLTDKLSPNKSVTVSYRTTIYLMLYVVSIFLVPVVYLVTNLRRLPYMILPTITIVIGVTLIVRQIILINRSSGPLLEGSLALLVQLMLARRVRKGKLRHLRNVGINNIDSDGLIYFANGKLGYLFQIDGNNSPTSFPSDKERENELSRQYQNGRKVTTVMATYSSSQLQDAEPQLINMKRESNNCGDKRIQAVIDLQYLNTKENIDKVQPTIVQYTCIIEVNKVALNDAVNRLYEYTDKNLFYSCVQQDGEQASNYYTDLYGLK